MTDKKQRPSKEERRRADRAISQDELATRERDFVMRLMTGENVLDDIEVPKWKLTTLAEAEKILIHLGGEIKDLERAVGRLKTNVCWGLGLVACILILILYSLL